MGKSVFLFLLLALEAGYSFPQGFFPQGLSIPRLVHYDRKSQSLELPLNIKIESPVKGSLLNIFGKKNSNLDKSKKDHVASEVKSIPDNINEGPHSLSIDDNYSKVSTHKKATDKTNKSTHVESADIKDGEILATKSVTDNEIINTETTTEYITETTTDDYETTTFFDEPLNRSGASPALVASLLG